MSINFVYKNEYKLPGHINYDAQIFYKPETSWHIFIFSYQKSVTNSYMDLHYKPIPSCPGDVFISSWSEKKRRKKLLSFHY